MQPRAAITIGTWNLNGVRSAVRKGALQALGDHRPDVLLLQELKCDARRAAELLAPLGYEVTALNSAEPGRSGVAILTRETHRTVELQLGHSVLDTEGRLLAVRCGGVEYWSCYAPSGAGKRQRLELKHEYLRRVVQLAIERASGAIVLAGDCNVAHALLDVEAGAVHRPGPGFLPAERACFDMLLEAGWVDLVRTARGNQPGPFTWRSRARGWRLDHLWASPASNLRPVTVSVGPAGPFSDHHLLLVQVQPGDPPSAAVSGPCAV